MILRNSIIHQWCVYVFISLSNMKGSPKNSHKRQRAKIRARLEI